MKLAILCQVGNHGRKMQYETKQALNDANVISRRVLIRAGRLEKTSKIIIGGGFY